MQTGLLQLLYKVSFALIVAIVIHKYSFSPFEGGVSVHPLGVLIELVRAGGLVLLVLTANRNSVYFPSWASPSLPLTGRTSPHIRIVLSVPSTLPIHCHHCPLVVG